MEFGFSSSYLYKFDEYHHWVLGRKKVACHHCWISNQRFVSINFPAGVAVFCNFLDLNWTQTLV